MKCVILIDFYFFTIVYKIFSKKIFPSFSINMHIYCDKNCTKPSFGVNLKSPRLKFRRDDFFIRIRGYGKNYQWADCVKDVADSSVDMIRRNSPFEDVLKYITEGLKIANQLPLDFNKRVNTGILRTKRDGWQFNPDFWASYNLVTPYGKGRNYRYKSYELKLDSVREKPLNNPYDDVELTRPVKIKKEKYLRHANGDCINKSFSYIEKLYDFIIENYINKEVKQSDITVVNNSIAQIRWLMAHSTPWMRGSDAISNVFMKALYKAIGIKTSRPAKGISFDLEAYCLNLVDYKKKFPSLFEVPPVIVE